jgi:hypothetical protein
MPEVGGDLSRQCEKLRELIFGDHMPIWADEDRKRMRDSSEASVAREDWHVDPGTTYHRKIKKRLNPHCSIPVWDPVATPKNSYTPPKEGAPWSIPPPPECTLKGTLQNGCRIKMKFALV